MVINRLNSSSDDQENFVPEPSDDPVIQIGDQHKAYLQTLVNKEHEGQMIVETGGKMIRAARELTWEYINNLYPETKDGQWLFDWKNFTVFKKGE